MSKELFSRNLLFLGAKLPVSLHPAPLLTPSRGALILPADDPLTGLRGHPEREQADLVVVLLDLRDKVGPPG